MAPLTKSEWSVAVNGDIREISGSSTHTTLELHRFLMDLLDDATASGDDFLDVTNEIIPSTRFTDEIIQLNSPYNIGDVEAERYFGGSIDQDGGNTQYSGLQMVGTVNLATTFQVVQNNLLLTAHWGTGINVDASNQILNRILIKSRVNGVDIDGKRVRTQAREMLDTFAQFPTTLGQGEAVAAITTIDDSFNDTLTATVATWTDIVNNLEGFQPIDLNNGNGNRNYFSEWDRASRTTSQFYERMKWITRRGSGTTQYGMNGELFRGITHSWLYDAETNGPYVQNQVLKWGTTFAYDNEAGGPFAAGDLLSFGTSGAVGTLLHLEDLGATGVMVVAIQPGSGTVVDDDPISQIGGGATADVDGLTRLEFTGVVGGTAALLAFDDQGATGTLFVQLLTGAAPTDGQAVFGGTNTEADLNGAPTVRTLTPVHIGSYTGSFSGAFGVGVEAADLVNTDSLIDLTGTSQSPPNNVTVEVTGLVAGDVVFHAETRTDTDSVSGAHAVGDTTLNMTTAIPATNPQPGRIVVDGTEIVYLSFAASAYTLAAPGLPAVLVGAEVTTVTSFVTDTYSLASGNNSGNGTVVINETIATDHPTSGELRIFNDVNLVYDRYAYTSFTGSTFTLSGTLSQNYTLNDPAFVPFIDQVAGGATVSVTIVYTSDIPFRLRVYNSGAPIVPFEVGGTVGAGGVSTQAIRGSDA